MSEKKRDGFVFGALILSFSGLITKIAGLIFRVVLTRMIGGSADVINGITTVDATMSHFSSAYAVYTFLLSLSTSGLPIGISAMVSRSLALGKYKDIKTLMRSVTIIFVSAGGFLTVLGLIFSQPIAMMMNSAETRYCMMYIMPAVFFIAVVSVFRGFFQGYNNMAPTSVSNLIEAFLKLGAGLGISYIFQLQGRPAYEIVAGGILGVTVGTVGACLYMVLKYVFRRKEYRITLQEFVRDAAPTPKSKLLGEFWKITLPIALSSVSVQLMGLIDSSVVVQTLKDVMGDLSVAQSYYGAYSNKATTIFNLPSFFIITIGVSLVPSISAAFAKKDQRAIRYTVNKALRYSSILAFACAFGLAAVGTPVVNVIFGGSYDGMGGKLLSVLSLSLVAVGLTNVTSYMLQAIGKAYLSVISVVVGALVKSVCTWVLVSIPSINIYGAPIATNIAYPIMLLINLYFLYKHMHIIPKIRVVFVKPLITGLCCFASAFSVLKVFEGFASEIIALTAAIFAGAVVYIALLFVLKLVTFDEIKQIFKKS